jgi:hypothetical protein
MMNQTLLRLPSAHRPVHDLIQDVIRGIGVVVPETDSEEEWLIPGYIHPTITAITGQPERGKTTLLISMCKGLLDGQWLGIQTNLDPQALILFGCEDRQGARRVRRAFGNHPRVEPFWLTGWEPANLAAGLETADVGLLVLDSLTAVVTDINDQSEATAFIRTLRGLPTPVVVVHHSAVGGRGPSGAQPYKAAYRHTVEAQKLETEGDDGVVVTLRRSGNDIATVTNRVAVDRTSYAAEHAAERLAERLPRRQAVSRQTKPTAGEKARILKHLADCDGIETGQLDHNAIATQLVGGPRGQEDPKKQTMVAEALGAERITHRTVSNIVRLNRAIFAPACEPAA